MKKSKVHYYRTWLWACFMKGKIDRILKHNEEIMDSVFLMKRKAGYTEYVANAMIELDDKIKGLRTEAEILISSMNPVIVEKRNCLRNKRLLEKQKAQTEQLIKITSSVRSETLKAHEYLIPYSDILKAQVISYAKGYKKNVDETDLNEMFPMEQNKAYKYYLNFNQYIDELLV